MLTSKSIHGSHQLNQSYGLVRRGELDHQEAAFAGPTESKFLNDDRTVSVADLSPGQVGGVAISISLEVDETGSRRFRIA